VRPNPLLLDPRHALREAWKIEMGRGSKGSPVSGDITRNHYARLAATYDENWAYSPAFIEWMTGCIRQRLRITSDSLVADIGCGTGLYARVLAQDAASVVCIDASAQMLAKIPSDTKLVPVTASAEDLASGRGPMPHDGYDALLLKEVLHHVEDPSTVLAGLARMLRPGGRILVVMLPSTIAYPLFSEALELFAALQPDPADIATYMRGAGLETDLTYDSFALTFETGRYLQMVRNRYMSLLSHFDDAQLESGVTEIRARNPGARISFTDTFAFVLGTT